MLINIAFVVVGIALLYYGGEWLVRSSTAMAAALGVTPFVIACTVVAFGTSAPELATSVVAALRDQPDIALGNVIGSNTANIGLILGVAALIAPLSVDRRLLRREVPFMIATAFLLTGFCLTGQLSYLHALILTALLAAFLFVIIKSGEPPPAGEGLEIPERVSLVPSAVGTVGGTIMLVSGAWFLVRGASAIAAAIGIPDAVVSLTLVAFGTSLPELASCAIAVRHGDSDFVLGNVIGSNVFNTLLIVPSTVALKPFATPPALWTPHLIVMVAFSLLLLVIFTRPKMGRAFGTAFLVAYLGYVIWIGASTHLI